MIEHNISFDKFIPHGKVTVNIENDELHMTGGVDRGSYIEIPQKYKLPFRIDMTAKMDSPALILKIGDGYIHLNTSGMDNRRMMSIIGGEKKPNIHKFDNHVSLNEYFNISVIYGKKSMQLIINGEERYFNQKDIYMKSPLTDTDFKDGFGLKLFCYKRTEVYIKSLVVTEYADEPEFESLPKRDFIYNTSITKVEKPTLEDCIKGLSPELIDCIVDMDEHLRALKFRRLIEGSYPESRITYTKPKVTLWKMSISSHLMTHWTMAMVGIYVDGSGKCEEKFNTLLLRKLEEYSPDLAEDIFLRMSQSHYCNKDYGGDRACGGCGWQSFNITEYKGTKKNNCAHFIQYKMIPADFDDVKKVLDVILSLSEELPWR